ncbi:homoserine kinase [Kroppenstedtia pulmonis]|uniref:Homoserine kinase n=1 Tax=Kroppenstedtia pulmonis TaxID=1380685 RepID=A0A7D4CV89_9BACL|nr:homoserine kinase [Kroppenstedtia pulmonis]QKG84117.1 homoserine kinase [Kroppenstedtia pulmonis]
MNDWESFDVVVPGSTANLGAGFDSIGMAVNRFLRMTLSPAQDLKIDIQGKELESLKDNSDNLVVQVIQDAFQEMGRKMPGFRLEMKSDIPLMGGLGSSAAAIVAGLAAANHLLGKPWSQEELLQKATRIEGHSDNVGASLFGGVVVTSWDGTKVDAITSSPPPLCLVAAIPRFPLATSKSREVLPEVLSYKEAILGSSRANLLTAALLTGNWEQLRVGMNDRFHQPYRLSLVPGLEQILEEAYEYGALGVALSGAGPTVVAFTLNPEPLSAYLKGVFTELKLPADILLLEPCTKGLHVDLTKVKDRSTLLRN